MKPQYLIIRSGINELDKNEKVIANIPFRLLTEGKNMDPILIYE